MINVGRHDDLVISKTHKNDKGSLVVTVKKVTVINPMEALNNGGSIEQPEQEFLQYPPKLEGKTPGVPDTYENLMLKISEVTAPLTHIASQYMTSDKIKYDMWKGTGITSPEDLKIKLPTSTVLAKVYENITDQWAAMMRPFVGDTGKKMRMLFVRQSKVKHFPKFRSRYLETQPFIEPMTVPESASKLKFSDYDKREGLDNPNPAGGAVVVNKADAQAAESLFKKPAQ